MLTAANLLNVVAPNLFQSPLIKTKKLIGDAGITFTNAVSTIYTYLLIILSVSNQFENRHLKTEPFSVSLVILLTFSLLSPPSVCCQPIVLSKSSQHPDWKISPQSSCHQQHLRGELQQQSLAEERGSRHFPCFAQELCQLPDLFCWEIPQPGEG